MEQRERISRQRTVRVNVKTGCRTCKIRKVKCDEGRPACNRCISTGRVCDGYGIWGGGGNQYGHRQRHLQGTGRTVAPQLQSCISILPADTDERVFLEWFQRRTAPKLPGSFVSEFWRTLLFQASLDEPAVLHAVLALSCVHRGGVLDANNPQNRSSSTPDAQEQFTLRHYGKAIWYLQPYLSTNLTRASFRVALITCIVFVCLELLRGHFQTAQNHLRNGLRILGEMQPHLHKSDDVCILKPCTESVDSCIVEAISRLHIQAELLRPMFRRPCLVLQPPAIDDPATVFRSLKDAWRGLEPIFSAVFYLSTQTRLDKIDYCAPPFNPTPLDIHRQLRTKLDRWLDASRSLQESRDVHRSSEEQMAVYLLCTHHSMLSIMTDTCMWPGNEMIYDDYTDQFMRLVEQMARVWALSVEVRAPPSRFFDMSRSMVDMGWIPALYYVAVKCRVHRIRLQAIRLLELSPHREGIWDAITAARVARKIMEVEEGFFYVGIDTADDFLIWSSPTQWDLELPTLPESHRIKEAEMVPSGSPMDKVLLFSQQRQDGEDCRVQIAEYDVALQRWVDITESGGRGEMPEQEMA